MIFYRGKCSYCNQHCSNSTVCPLNILDLAKEVNITNLLYLLHHHHHHHHHHVPEGLGVFPVPWSPRWSWSLYLFLGRPIFLRPFGLYCSACFGSLFVSILCKCCSHFFWYCFIAFTVFCAPVFCLIHWFFSLSSFVIPNNCIYFRGNIFFRCSETCYLVYWHIVTDI